MVVVLAGYIVENPINENKNFLKALALIAVPTMLVFLQPDLGTALVFGAMFVTMAYIGGAKIYRRFRGGRSTRDLPGDQGRDLGRLSGGAADRVHGSERGVTRRVIRSRNPRWLLGPVG